MAVQRKFFVGGNWKMNGSKADCDKLVGDLIEYAKSVDEDKVDIVISPPIAYLFYCKTLLGSNEKIKLSAQNCYLKSKGAFTGETSPEMLRDIGVNWTILGHSERRELFHETNELVAQKIKFSRESGMSVIACVGEKLEDRESGKTNEVIFSQLDAIRKEVLADLFDGIVIAYEPVWAIGTGKVATPEQAQEVHVEIRQWIGKNYSEKLASNTRIIYGGSVNAKNCAALAKKADIDGFLVGGASLKPEFSTVIDSFSSKLE